MWWGQYSGCPGRGYLGSVDLGAYGSQGDIKYGEHSQRYCKEIRKECCWGSVSREGTREKTQNIVSVFEMINSKLDSEIMLLQEKRKIGR